MSAPTQLNTTQPSVQIESVPQNHNPLYDLFTVCLNYKRSIIAIVLLGFVVGFSYNWLFSRHFYTAEALLEIESARSTGVSLSLDVLEQTVSGLNNPVHEIEVIRSRNTLSEVIDKLHLDWIAQPNYFPLIGKAMAYKTPPGLLNEPWLGMNSHAWGGEIITITDLDIPAPLTGIMFSLIAKGKGQYALLHPINGKVILTGEAGKPAQGTVDKHTLGLTINTLKANPGTQFTVGKLSKETAIKQLRSQLNISEKIERSYLVAISTSKPSEKLARDIVNTVASVYIEQNNRNRARLAQERIEFLIAQIPILKSKMSDATGTLRDFQAETSPAIEKEISILVSEVASAKGELSQHELKYSELRQTYTPAHPKMRSWEQQRQTLSRKVAVLQNKLQALPQLQQKSQELTQDANIASTLLNSLLGRAQELELLKASTRAPIRIIDQASTTLVIPNEKYIIGFYILIAAAIALIQAFIRHRLNQAVLSSEVLEQRLNCPVIANIPYTSEQSRVKPTTGPPILGNVSPQNMAVEGIRGLYVNLKRAGENHEKTIVLITGTAPNVGKSFVCMNLAHLYSYGEKKILVIDADTFRGHLHDAFVTDHAPGLSELLCDEIELNDAIHKTPYKNLDFMPTGKRSTHSSEFTFSENLAHILHTLKERYDTIIIDSPPILAVNDAAAFAPYATQSLLMVRYEKNSFAQVEAAKDRLEKAGANNIYLALNYVNYRKEGYYGGKYPQYYNYYTKT